MVHCALSEYSRSRKTTTKLVFEQRQRISLESLQHFDTFCKFLYGLFVLASTQPETRLRHLSSQVSLPLLLRGLSLRTRRVGLFQIRLELSRRALVTGFEAPIPQPKCAGVLRSQRKLLKLHDLGTEKRFNASGLRPSSLQGASTEWKPNNKETRAQLALLALFCIVL